MAVNVAFTGQMAWLTYRSNFRTAKGGIVTVRRLILGVGTLLLLAGIIGLLTPVSISDGNGHSIGCGNAVAEDLSAARNANNTSVAGVPVLNQIVPHTDYVG